MKHTLKQKLGRAAKSAVSLLLACVLLLGTAGMIPANIALAKTVLTNVAPKATISVDSNPGKAELLNDGNLDNDWQYQTAFKDIPDRIIQIRMKLEAATAVKQIKVHLGSPDWADTQVDVQAFYAQNGITSDMIPLGNKVTAVLGGVAVIDVAQDMNASDVYIEISNPTLLPGATHTDFTLWPSVREVEIFAEQEVKLSEFNNIASQAVVSTDGIERVDTRGYLVDGDPATLYKFHDAQQTEPKNVWLTWPEVREMDAARITFEHVDNEPHNYQFNFSLYGVKEDGSEVLLAENQTANRTDKFELDLPFAPGSYKAVKVLMHSCTTANGNGWPAIAELAVFGSEKKVEDKDSIAFHKPVHTNLNRKASASIVDGNPNSQWTSPMYPSYADIDLEANYNLSEIQVFTPAQGYSQYKIYTSLDGRDFTKLAEKNTTAVCPAEGESYAANGVEARYVRVYVTYNSASANTVLNEVRVLGTPAGTPVQELPAIKVEPYGEPHVVTPAATYAEVQGIITRRLGAEYVNWFNLELAENPNGTGYDFFQLANDNGKIKITGNDGVSLATGLNYFLKYSCNVNLTQVGDQAVMPAAIPTLTAPVFKETKAKVRYAYNYCTLSYSMPFYGEQEWRDELDWLALNGVNVVLDATAQEEVWRRFLGKLGYSHADSKDFVAGPAYYAWAYMANLSGFGGPVHDSWFEERTALARKNHVIMRNLGMEPVLQGYSGMIPNDLAEHDPAVAQDIIKQPTWCSFQRPDMLKTDTPTYDKYAKLFYEAQQEVYGPGKYFATDPFHEGGNTGGMSPRVISRRVMETMLAENGPDAVWIIQSWQGNPTSELLAGLEGHRENALVLDLYAEKSPHYGEGRPNNGSYGYNPEFDNTPWAFCMLNNFGGRLGLHGHLDNLANNVPAVFNSQQHIAGIGITPEASVNNPLLYDYFFEIVWQDDASHYEVVDLDTWLEAYGRRRYGAESANATEALRILKDTVYKASLNNRGQGAPESIVNARPRFDINAASTWGNSVIGYDKVELERAARLLLDDYDLLKDSAGYQYDLATILQQILSNYAQNQLARMKRAFNSRDLEKFQAESDKFLRIIDNMEAVTSTSKYYMLGNWVNQAKRLAANADDFAKDIYEWNAKALVTTWGSINQANGGGLSDYANRQWSGLLNDFYKMRWELFIHARISELKGESFTNPDWFPIEWQWTWGKTEYPDTPSGADLKALGETILTDFSVFGPEMDPKNDIPVSQMTVETGSFQPNNATEGDPNYVLDNNPGTIWHTNWGGSPRDQHYLTFTLSEAQPVSGLRYMGRNGNNGAVKAYEVYVRANETDEWTKVIANGVLDPNNGEWQILKFDGGKEYTAKQVKFQVLDAISNNGSTLFAAAAELRILKGTPQIPAAVADVMAKIDALGEITLAKEEAVKAARAAFNALPADQKAMVENTAKLTAAEAALSTMYELKGASLSVGGDIAVNFFFRFSEEMHQNAQVVLTVEDGEAVTLPAAEAVQTDNGYRFTASVPVRQMRNPITIEVQKDGEPVKPAQTFSVRKYADSVLAGDYPAATKDFVKAMLFHGSAMQTYKDYTRYGLADADLDVTALQQAAAEITAADLSAYKPTMSGKAEGLTLYGMNLSLMDETALRFYFTKEAGIKAEQFTFNTGAYQHTVTENDTMICVEVADISASHLDEAVTLKVGGLTVTYSPLSYARSVILNAKADALEKVARSLVLYNQYANALPKQA